MDTKEAKIREKLILLGELSKEEYKWLEYILNCIKVKRVLNDT